MQKPLLKITLAMLINFSFFLDVPGRFLSMFESHAPFFSPAQAASPFGFSDPNIFVDIVKAQKPAVVNISAAQITKEPSPKRFRGFGTPFERRDPFHDFFEKFFENTPRGDMKKKSLGSGFIVDQEGYILTNSHVIENAEEITVHLDDDKEYKARIIGDDPKTDIALIKIDQRDPLPVAKMGDSDKLEVGEWVIAIGNPFGFTQTVTVGVVSAKGRVINAGPYDNFIQTDASINPGNSGGPLLNLKGEVIGINTAIIATGQGIGFAIPINMAKNILEDLKMQGSVVRGWIGVMIQKITPELIKAFKIREIQGAYVSDVIKDSPADKAGVRRGDIITAFDGKPVQSVEQLPRIVADTRPGRVISADIVRDGVEKHLKIKIEKLAEGSK